MTLRALALAAAALAYLAVPLASAEPILEPRKYHGPIPQSSFAVRVGMLGNANNQEMISYLDGRIKSPFYSNSKDFGNGLNVELSYAHKPHPHFSVEVTAAAAFLRSSSDGIFVPQIPSVPDTLPVVQFHRTFDVDLFTIQLSGLYHFHDAAVNEFQPYLGGGFSLGFPHEKIAESRVVQDTGQPFTENIPGVPGEASQWAFGAGVHLVGGMIYYLNNRFGISGEGRVQLMQSRFEKLKAENEVGQFEPVSFVVDYTGFLLSVGVTYAF